MPHKGMIRDCLFLTWYKEWLNAANNKFQSLGEGLFISYTFEGDLESIVAYRAFQSLGEGLFIS